VAWSHDNRFLIRVFLEGEAAMTAVASLSAAFATNPIHARRGCSLVNCGPIARIL